VQNWLVNNPTVMSDSSVTGTRDELAAALSVPRPTHPLWVHTSRVSERAVQSVTVDVVGDRELGVASRPRRIGTDLELIRLIPLDQLDVDEHGLAVWRPGQTVQNVALLLRHGADGCRIAGAGSWLPRPGWPPSSRPSSVRTTDHSDLACSQGDTRTDGCSAPSSCATRQRAVAVENLTGMADQRHRRE
jgi:hypothetical protein